jgi:hypothetical protein
MAKDDPWYFFTPEPPVPEGYVVGIKITYTDGRARLGSVRIDWNGDGDQPRLPPKALRSIPFDSYVQKAHAELSGDASQEEAPKRPRGGSSEFSQRVADVFRGGMALGAGVRSVSKTWNVSEGTAERWIRQARKDGLLEESERSRGDA